MHVRAFKSKNVQNLFRRENRGIEPNKLRNVAHYSALDVNVAEVHEFE